MADRYWVGGTGTWNTTNTANWSATSGGAGGATAPTSADDVFFDTNSGTGSITGTGNCRNLTVTATQALSFIGGTGISVYGSISMVSGGSFTWGAMPLNLRSTTTGNTLDFNGKAVSQNVSFLGVGGEWTVLSNWVTNGLFFYNGTFNAGSNTLTTGAVILGNGSLCAVNLQSSTIAIYGTNPWGLSNTTNLTVDFGTSTINCTSASAVTFAGSGMSFYNVGFTGGGTTTVAVTGANTYNTLSVTANAAGTKNITFDSTQTINGTLSTSGTTTANRVQFGSSVAGTQRTLSVASIGTLTNTNFKDIALTGAASPWAAPLGVWDLKNNSGITFDTTTLYWIGGAGAWTDGTHWSTASGGTAANVAPGSTNSVILDTSSGTGSISGTGYCNDLTSTASQALVQAANVTVYGSLALPAGGSSSSTGALTFVATTSGKTINANGKGSGNITFNGVGGVWDFQSNYGGSFNLNAGTVNINGYSVGIINVSGNLTKALYLGAATLNYGGGAIGIYISGLNTTFDAGTSTINFNAGQNTISADGFSFYDMVLNGRSASLVGAMSFRNLTVLNSIENGTTVSLSKDIVVNGTLSSSVSATPRRVQIYSDTYGTQRTITAAAVSLSDTDFYGIVGAGAATWSGTRLGNGTLNSGITFPSPKTVYWNLAAGGNWNATAWATSSGGTPSNDNYPLPQDTAIIENTGLNTSATISMLYPNAYTTSSFFYPNIDFSSRTNAMTFSFAALSRMCGNVTTGSGVTYSGTLASTFLGSTTLTSAGKTFTAPITVAAGATLTTADTLTSSSTLTNNGTLTLGANATFTTCTLGAASTTNFSTNKISLTGNAATIFTGSPTQTVTGTPVVECSYSGATGTRTISPSAVAESNTISFNITAGTDIIALTGSSKNVGFTGFAGTLNNGVRTLYGNLTISTGMTLTAGASTTTFAATSGTNTITTNGKTLDFPLTFNGVGGTWQLQDNLTQGTAYTFTLTNGTLDLNGKTYTVGSFATAAGTKNLTFNGGTLTIPAVTTTAFNNAQPTNFTTTAGTGTGKISMTGATAKTFVGGGSVYNCKLEQAGAGTLTITHNNTFAELSNTVQPTQFTFTSGTTQNIAKWSVNGTAGNLVILAPSSTTNYTLNYIGVDTVEANYLSISRSTATPTLTWLALNSTNGGNNSGWYFGSFPAASTGNGLLFGSNF